MNHELLVLCGRDLPVAHERPLALKLGSIEGIEVHELIHGSEVDAGFEARVVLSVAPATMVGHSVAARLASVLDGVVFDGRQERLSFDGRGGAAVDDLERVAKEAFDEATRAWRAIELAHLEQERTRYALMAVVDPILEAENDWSSL